MSDLSTTTGEAIADELKATVERLAKRFPGAAVAVMLDVETPGHSNPFWYSTGPCLRVIGLLDVGTKGLRDLMPEAYRR